MAKDPAFLFYPADWLVGTMTMSPAQKGTYMDLLCIAHQKGGRLQMEDFEFYKCADDKKIMAKFKQADDGSFYNARLETESQRRKNFVEKQAHNGKRGGRPKANINPKETQIYPNENPNTNPTQTNNININEDENININVTATETVNGNANTKKRKPKNPKTETLLIEFPFTSDQFLHTWHEWKEYKRESHRFEYKSRGEQAALMKLAEDSNHDEPTAIKLILQAMASNWQGIYPLKNQRNEPARNAAPTFEEFFTRQYGSGQPNGGN